MFVMGVNEEAYSPDMKVKFFIKSNYFSRTKDMKKNLKYLPVPAIFRSSLTPPAPPTVSPQLPRLIYSIYFLYNEQCSQQNQEFSGIFWL